MRYGNGMSFLVMLAWMAACWPRPAAGAELLVGTDVASITHERPIALQGQMHTRIGAAVDAPLEASAVALESRDGDRSLDHAIMVSCDVCYIPAGVVEQVRAELARQLPDVDARKLFLSATHTHTGPVFEDGLYHIPQEGVLPPSEYTRFFVERVADAAARAWRSRKPGAAGWGLGHAVVGHNRRAVYADGSARMYGATDDPAFRGIEGYEDHALETLLFWDREEKLVAAAINFACTAQEVEGKSAVDADFVHPVRKELRRRHGEQLAVLAWISAAGDQSPHLMFRKRAEDRMRELRGLSRLDEIARRIVAGFDEAFEGARQDIRTDVPLVHKVETLTLPLRLVTDQELADARAQVASLSKDPAQQRSRLWHQAVIDRHERQQSEPNPARDFEIHVLRLGDVAICTNPFELFLDFGIQMKSRSKAIQTFVIQLVGGAGYVPTQEAVRGGGYSAVVQSNRVGPEGGQMLVERTVELINGLWPPSP
ncbi:MAG: hypothetical protein JXA90_09745 [Planctomycetes bacterium]|nr:hypothetical protein [Planctomycetota bacterium]